MSWDVSVAWPGPLPAGEVRRAVSAVHPAVSWSDPAWGVLEGAGWSIEVHLGTRPDLDSLMLHVRGNGDPLPAIAALCRANGWSANDLSTGEDLDLDRPSRAGWDGFRSFRAAVAEAIPAGDGSRLPKSGLRLDGATLVRTAPGGATRHDLAAVRGLRLESAVNQASVGLAVVCLVAGLLAQRFLPWPWLGWLCLALLSILAALFGVSARTAIVVFDEDGRKVAYPLLGRPDEVAAFRSRLKALGAADPRSRSAG